MDERCWREDGIFMKVSPNYKQKIKTTQFLWLIYILLSIAAHMQRRKLMLSKEEPRKSQKLWSSLKTISVSNRNYTYSWGQMKLGTWERWQEWPFEMFLPALDSRASWIWFQHIGIEGTKKCIINVDLFFFLLSSEIFSLREHNFMYFKRQSRQIHGTKLWKTSHL